MNYWVILILQALLLSSAFSQDFSDAALFTMNIKVGMAVSKANEQALKARFGARLDGMIAIGGQRYDKEYSWQCQRGGGGYQGMDPKFAEESFREAEVRIASVYLVKGLPSPPIAILTWSHNPHGD